MSETQKDTIYIDVDDEITSIIDKMNASKHKIVALVLPKRALVLQSIVNMKLLHKAAHSSKKRPVLITSEANLLPMAGAVGLHVAKTLQSKPHIPAAPDVPTADLSLDEADAIDATDADVKDNPDKAADLDKTKSIGDLAGLPSAASAADETIELDNSAPAPAIAAAKAGKKANKAAEKGNKKLKVPNFESFRAKLLLGGAAVLLLAVLFYLANFVLPKASVVIKTDNINLDAKVDFTASTAVSSLDTTGSIAPGTLKEVKKSETEKVPATGKKDIGTKAGGSVTLSLQDCARDSVTIPAGTGVSSGDKTFMTQADLTLNSVKIGNSCRNNLLPAVTSGTVKVLAQDAGDGFNLSERNYNVAGLSNVSAKGTAMTGGTSNVVTIISQEDINGARAKLVEKTRAPALEELKKVLKDQNLFPLTETLNASDPGVTATPNAGEQASEVTVNAVIAYSMMGAKRDDLRALVEQSVKKQIDTSKQSISDDGLDTAVFRLVDRGNGQAQRLSVQTKASTGTKIDQEALKKQLVGKKSGDIRQLVGTYPGVKEVNVNMSPFWVTKAPSKTSRIHLFFEQPNK